MTTARSSSHPRPNPPDRHNSHTRQRGGASFASSSSSSAPSTSSAVTADRPPYPVAPILSSYLQSILVPSISPSVEEYAAKEAARVLLESFVERLWPGAKLKPFGSMANGFALKNSDMDLCCFRPKESAPLPAGELVEMLGRLIEQETNFRVKMLSRARIPIVKLVLPATMEVPFEMACDIGFENRLALENTRLLYTYAKVDARVRFLVLFLKVWTKRRQINNPYRGTLSSYGYVLLVIHFLTNVKSPPVLPNLQRLPLLKTTLLADMHCEGCDIWFFDELDKLPLVWQSENSDSVGDLLIDMFHHYAKEFNYPSMVISIRSEGGLLTKESKGWQHETFDYESDVVVRDLYKLCIEDPFQEDYNVSRTVTRDGLYTIRGEFMRGFRILSARSPIQIAALIAELCEEREDALVLHPSYSSHLPHPLHSAPDKNGLSPRRKSAPSPRMTPVTSPPLPPSMESFRLWAAINVQSVGSHERSHVRGLGVATDALAEDTRKFPSSLARPVGTSSQSRPSGASPTFALPQDPQHSFIPPLPPNPTLERRVSWDGSAPASTSTTLHGYNLHQSFQSPPYHLSQSSVPYSGVVRFPLTAPPSPNLMATSSSRSARSLDTTSALSGVAEIRSVAPRMAASVPASLKYSNSRTSPMDDPTITFGTFPTHPSSAWLSTPTSSTSELNPQSLAPRCGNNLLDADERSRNDSTVVISRGRSFAESQFLENVVSREEGMEEVGLRRRGRSVPHVRVDSEGRESILFGEIAVVLPPSRRLSSRSRSTSLERPEDGQGQQRGDIPNTTRAIVSTPTLTTSPPTPIKSVRLVESRRVPNLAPSEAQLAV